MGLSPYCLFVALAAAPLALSVAPATAQESTSWVSVIGNDGNPCTEASPCRTFSQAYSAAGTGGTIRCLNTGSFGGLTIFKSITIDCKEAGPGAPLSHFVISSAGIQVVLRGLTVDGGQDSSKGTFGLEVNAAATVVIEDCVFRDAKNTGINFGLGIVVQNSSGLVELTIRDTVVTGSRLAGIRVKPTGTGSARVAIEGSSVTDNGAAGIEADAATTSGQVNIHVVDTVLAGNSTVGLAAIGGGAGNVAVLASRVSSVNNGSHGMRSTNAKAVLRVSDSDITGNIMGTEAVNGGVITSFGNNRIIGNNGNNGPVPPIIALQ